MIFLVVSIVCSVLVSVHLKLARRIAVDIPQAVAWNYVVAGVAALLMLRPPTESLRHAGTAWWPLIGLGVLLPTIFVALGASVRHAGIVRSDAAQRLSLVLSLLAAFVLFGQRLTPPIVAGMVIGLVGLLALVWRAGPQGSGQGASAWLYPLIVFAGFGAIDVLLKRVSAAGVPLGASLLAMFALALPVALGIAAVRAVRGGARFTRRSFAAGLLLGLLNFGNILFYLRAHQALPHDPALVFAAMNLGVVALGAVVGVLAFGERLSRVNAVGLVLALAAIAVLARS
ncbi:MAG TPA: EamA/RhaT family transporter [Dyella sp.]|nr:EamA/RhaT family transporter [Dyella sp.]